MKEDSRYKIKTIHVHLRVAEMGTPEGSALVREAKDAARVAEAILADLDADQEHFVLLALNTRHIVTGYKVIASGGQDNCVIDPKIVFRSALLLGAAAIIVAHNHPSGLPDPSADDLAITERIQSAGRIIGIALLDHLIFGQNRWMSLHERGDIRREG